MKKLKITGIILISLVTLFYILFLFVLPNILDSKFAKDLINDLAKENLGVELNIGKITLQTAFPLKGGAKIENTTVICNNNNKNIELKSVGAKVNLFSLLLKKISITDVYLEGLTVSSNISQTGELSIMNCFVLPQEENAETQESSSSFVLDDKFPDINIKDVNLSLIDEETKNKLSLNLNALELSDIVLNNHFKINTIGKILLNDKENIVFDIKAKSFMPEFKENKEEAKTETEYFNFIKEFAKYNPNLKINSDIKISNNNNNLVLDGFANLDDITFNIGKIQIPKSFIHIKSDKNKADITSEFYISDKEKFNLISSVKNSKTLNLDLNFKTDKLSFSNIQKLACEILSTFNIENEFKNEKINGYLTSDLKFKTNSKKLTSQGYLKIINGELISDKIGLYVKEFNSNIQLDNNTLRINNTSLKVNDALIYAKGSIDENANTNIEISTNKLPVAKLAAAFLTGNLKKNYNINSGLLDLTVKAQGKLEKLKPSINLVLSSLNIFDKQNKLTLTNKKTTANITTDGKDFSGDVLLTSTKAKLPNFNSNVNISELKLNITPEELKINNSKINLNSSAINITGNITNYLKTPEMNFKLNGNILTNDIKNFIPKEMNSFINAKGSLPFKAQITGKNIFDIKAQILANSNNNLNFINIDKLQNKNTITNLDVTMENNNLNIKDAGIYIVQSGSLSDNLSANISGSNEIVAVKGNLLNFNTLKNIKLNINDTLGINMMNISAKATGNISANGNINNPQLSGNLSISNLNAPDYLIKNQTANINITPSNITAQIFGLNLNGDILDANFTMQNNFNMPYIITKANVDAKSIDLDKVLAVTAKFSAPSSSSQPVSSNSLLVPVTIKEGTAKIGNFKVGTIVAENITSDFTLYKDVLDMKNLKANAYKGSLTGEIKYNLKTLLMNANLNGENMDANPAVTSLLGIKDQIMGTLKFDADISLSGATLNEQLKSLKGTANFEVKDGQMGSLGRIETYLKAANIMSMKILETSINMIISTLLPYNSGQISLATGKLTFSNGNVYFSPIKTSGKEMSLFVTGNLNMINYNGDIKILGRLNKDMSNAMGTIANLSFEKIINSIPYFGTVTSTMLKTFNATTVPADINNIPQLTPNSSSKTFKVVLSGNVLSTKGVKSFQWLTTEDVLQSTESELNKKNSLPQTREDLVNEIKSGLENKKQEVIKETQELTKQRITETQQKVTETKKQITDKIESNQTLKNIKALSDFVKTQKEAQAQKEAQKTTQEAQ